MDSFIERHDSDDQGSSSWLEKTKNSTGGSSISGFMSSPVDYLIKKIFNTDPFNSNIAMDFGSLFENVVRSYLEKVLKTKLHVLGAVPYLKAANGELACHYSMDGMFKANASSLKGRNGELIFPDEERVYLLEIKTPWVRELKCYKRTCNGGQKGECNIPSNYRSQVKMGLVVIEPCEMGVFVDCLAKMCSLDDLCEERLLSFSEAHDQKLRNEITKVIASGVIKIYVNDITLTGFWNTIKNNKDFHKTIPRTLNHEVLKEQYQLQHDDYEPLELAPPIPFNYDPTSLLRFLIEDEKSHRQFTVKYDLVNLGVEGVVIDDEPNLLGYLPWKIFDLYYGMIEKDESFLSGWEEKLIEVAQACYDCKDKNEEEIERILEKVNL